MNKYLLLALLVVFWVTGDLYTKHLAQAQLASYSSRWEHPMVMQVNDDDAGKTVREWCVDELGTTLEDPEEAWSINRVWLVPDTGSPMPLQSSDTVQAGDTLQIRHRQVTVVPGFWNHVYVQNFGAAWGMFSQQSEAFRKPFFIIISIIAVIVVMFIYRNLKPGQWLLATALGSIVGGAIGNFIDRIRYGYVIDFIDWYVVWNGDAKHWPTFNIADVGISVGVTLMLLDIVFGQHDEPAKPTTPKSPESDAKPFA